MSKGSKPVDKLSEGMGNKEKDIETPKLVKAQFAISFGYYLDNILTLGELGDNHAAVKPKANLRGSG